MRERSMRAQPRRERGAQAEPAVLREGDGMLRAGWRAGSAAAPPPAEPSVAGARSAGARNPVDAAAAAAAGEEARCADAPPA